MKHANEEGLVNELIQLEPLNLEFASIKLTPENAVDLRVIGEFVCVL